jgi:hypothetical protein
MPEHMVQDLQDSNRELRMLLSSLRENVSNIRQQVADIRDVAAAAQQDQMSNIRDIAAQLPPEAMDPQQAGARIRPTSKAALAKLPRTVLTPQSSLLQQATVQVEGLPKAFSAVAADFGPVVGATTYSWKGVPLIVATPRTGGTTVSEETRRAIREASSPTMPILYMERGGGTTFAQKALAAQAVGACAIVIGNNTTASWPYVMKDSAGTAAANNLTIPLVMIRQSDAQALVAQSSSKNGTTKCTFQLETNTANSECIICVESMAVGQTVVQLSPNYCHHVFHEACAMKWLTQHHSCPYCRHELPTDDADFEADRRRRQTSGSGTQDVNTNGNNGDDFYG